MIDSCLSPHQLRGCCVYCPLVGLCHLLTLNPDPGKLTCTYAHVRNNWAHKQANGYMQERFCLTFSETHTHPDLKTTSLPRPPPPTELLGLWCILAADKEGPYSKASHSTWPSPSLFTLSLPSNHLWGALAAQCGSVRRGWRLGALLQIYLGGGAPKYSLKHAHAPKHTQPLWAPPFQKIVLTSKLVCIH